MEHIITYNNKILYKLVFILFALYNKMMNKYQYPYPNGR